MFRDRFRHPAFHIFALGMLVAAAILVVWGVPTGAVEKRVVVTGSDLLQLRAGYMRMWQREPSPSELRGLVDQHIRQEVLYREAIARGFDRDDPVVRRAMQQKMEFLAAAQNSRGEPTEEEIEAYFTLRREKYRLPSVLSLVQIFINPDGGDRPAEQRVAELLARVKREDLEPYELRQLGDSIMLEPVYENVTETELGSIFGADFAEAMVNLEPGSWQGPIRSGYGLHLCKVLARQDSEVPRWTEVRENVVRDMTYEARLAAKEQLYQEIAQGYRIVTDAEVAELLGSVTE